MKKNVRSLTTPDDDDVFVQQVRDRYGVTLSRGDAVIEQLDQVADRVKHTSGQSREDFEAGAASLIGRVLSGTLGGVWDDESGVFRVPNGTELSIRAWVHKRLRGGRAESLAAKTRVAVQLANPSPPPDWDPSWPEDTHASATLAQALRLTEHDTQHVDQLITRWLSLRKEVYLKSSSDNTRDAELTQIRATLTDQFDTPPLSTYAFARRHKAHAWVQHSRFGNAFSGPSGFLVAVNEKASLALDYRKFTDMTNYLAGTPQYREDSLLKALWQTMSQSNIRRLGSASRDRKISKNLLSLVSDVHEYTGTPHAKRLLATVDLADASFINALIESRGSYFDHYWSTLKSVVLCKFDTSPITSLRFGADALVWLDSARGKTPTKLWHKRQRQLAVADKPLLRALTGWLLANAEHLRRDANGEVIEPVSRWVKSARWSHGDSVQKWRSDTDENTDRGPR